MLACAKVRMGTVLATRVTRARLAAQAANVRAHQHEQMSQLLADAERQAAEAGERAEASIATARQLEATCARQREEMAPRAEIAAARLAPKPSRLTNS